ncbi:MAG: hypothetical protein ACOY3Z_06470 [Thermodesulfobacteriota bacterium]
MSAPPIQLIIHALPYQGRNALADRWPGFIADLRRILATKAQGETPETGDELLLFRFNTPSEAWSALLATLSHLKRAYGWTEEQGPLPLHLVLHQERQDELPGAMHDPSSDFWDMLHLEEPYATRALKLQWEQRGSGGQPPPDFVEAEKGLFLLGAPPEAIHPLRVEIFPQRDLTLSGSLQTCFYCGMNTHKPANCPSKLLGMETQGIGLAGYLPISRLAELFQEAMTSQEQMNNTLAAGLTASQIRKSPLLQTYLSYFDINLIYQPRFLRNIAFASSTASWEALRAPEAITADNHAMNMGLDCLRVGQHPQAEAMFIEENRRPKGRHFHAAIGRAFVALELERESDSSHFLENAIIAASSDLEKVYASLLLARFCALNNDPWKAGHALDSVLSLRRDMDEVLYSQLQSLARNDAGDKALRQLRSLLEERRELFVTAMLDPQLLPISSQVEDLLLARLQQQRQEAEEALIKARGACRDLQSWFAEGAEEMTVLLADLGRLEAQFEKCSYYDTLDVIHRAGVLLASCFRAQEKTLDAMKVEIARLALSLATFQTFWKAYPYPAWFMEFHAIMQKARARLEDAEAMARRGMHGQLFKTIQERMAQVRESLELLKPLSVKMGWMRITLDGVKLFGRKLLITELLVLGVAALLLPTLSLWDGMAASSGLVELLKTPLVQKKLLVAITLLVAPLIALAQTLWQIKDA